MADLTSIIGGVVDAATGGLGGLAKEIFNGVKSYFPPSMSEEQKAGIQLTITQQTREFAIKVMEKSIEAQRALTEQIAQLEGTAADLKAIPIVGHILILARGAQRPLWGLFTLYADWQVWCGAWNITDKQATMLYAVNIIVLIFLFGERGVKNLMPLIANYFGVKNTGGANGAPPAQPPES